MENLVKWVMKAVSCAFLSMLSIQNQDSLTCYGRHKDITDSNIHLTFSIQ